MYEENSREKDVGMTNDRKLSQNVCASEKDRYFLYLLPFFSVFLKLRAWHVTDFGTVPVRRLTKPCDESWTKPEREKSARKKWLATIFAKRWGGKREQRFANTLDSQVIDFLISASRINCNDRDKSRKDKVFRAYCKMKSAWALCLDHSLQINVSELNK